MSILHKTPVLVETALLGRGLPSLDNNLINYLWPPENILLPYAKEGIIKKVNLDEILKIRNQDDWQRIDARAFKSLGESKINGYLTTSALIELAHPHDLVVTAGMGGITGERISQDLEIIVTKPVYFISSGFKDVIDGNLSLEYLRSQGVKILGWKNPTYEGFLFAHQSHSLDGVVDENNIHNIDLKDDKGVLIFNPLPAYLKIQDKKLLAFAGEQMKIMQEKGLDFHPLVNELLDDNTDGHASFLQLIALIANINLAVKINRCLGG